MAKIPIQSGDYLRVRNLEKYQHYRDRCPPWVKLYQEILDDYDFGGLADEAKYHAIALILLASRLDNKIPNDPAWIGKKIQATEKVSIVNLIGCGFLEHVASNLLADCKQSARPEREGEGETEERDINAEQVKSVGAEEPPNGVPERWKDVADELRATTHLNRPVLYDWPWWEKLDRIYESNNDLDFLVEIRKMDEWLGRKRANGLKKDWKRFVANWLSNAGGQ